MIQPKVFSGYAHRLCNGWGFIELDFDPVATAPIEKEKIKLRGIMGSPEENFRRLQDPKCLFDGESLPGGSHLRVACETLMIGQAE